jgi:hypothetical protein
MKKAAILLLILLGSVSVCAQKVKVGADPAVDVAKYKTYAWNKQISPGNPIVQQSVIKAVDEAMAAKGLTKVETDPELTLVLWTATDSDLVVSYPSWSNAMGTAMSTGIAVGSQSWPVTKGTLVVDMEDARTKNSVWRATATHTLEHGPTGNSVKDAKSVEKPIRKAVEKMFKQFPHPNR